MTENANHFVEIPDLPDRSDEDVYKRFERIIYENKGQLRAAFDDFVTGRRIVLRDGEWRQFMDLVDSPPKPRRRLVEAMAEPDGTCESSGPLGNGGC